MSSQITTLCLGDANDSPKDGDFVTVDVTIWKFHSEKPDNYYKGEKYTTRTIS
jgi:hypothetical protein